MRPPCGAAVSSAVTRWRSMAVLALHLRPDRRCKSAARFPVRAGPAIRDRASRYVNRLYAVLAEGSRDKPFTEPRLTEPPRVFRRALSLSQAAIGI